MSRLRRTWICAAAFAAILGIGLSTMLGGAFGTAAATGASPSAVATNTTLSASAAFACRSSVAKVSLVNQTLLEPAVAGSSTNCPDTQSLVQQTNLLGSSALGSLASTLGIGGATVGPAGAYTGFDGSVGTGQQVDGVAVTDVNGLSLSFMGYTLSVAGPIQSEAVASCVKQASDTYATSPVVAGYSNLTALQLTAPDGTVSTVPLDQGVSALASALGPLSALISITPNELTTVKNATTGVPISATATLLDVKLLLSNVELVVGQSTATFPDGSGAICAQNTPSTNVTTVTSTDTVTTGTDGTVTTITGPTTTVTGTTTTTTALPAGSTLGFNEICAPGSVLDDTTGNCVIYDGTTAVFVSKPFKGPKGGTVVTLPQAKATYHSPCLSGAGRDWVLLVTTKNGSASGTPYSDRILGLNTGQKITGKAGNDCIDEMKANGHLKDGNGKDRLYVTSGSNRVIAGNGANVIHGRNGKNWITDGTGSDTIYAGNKANRIDAYGNHKRIIGGKANDRIWTNSEVAKVSCGGGKANVLFARKKVAAYAAKHGCQKIHLLK